MSRETVSSIPEPDRFGFLLCLTWLASLDGVHRDTEQEFLRAVCKDLGLGDDSVARALGEVKAGFTSDLLAERVQTPWVRRLLVHRLLLLAMADGEYDARERQGLLILAQALGIAEHEVEKLERGVIKDAIDLASGATGRARPSVAKRKKGWTWKKGLVVGGVAVGAAALVAVTGGLAAPAIGGAIGSTFMGLSGAAATSAGLAFLGGGALTAGGLGMAGGTALVAAAFGGAGGVIGARAMMKRGKDVSDFEILSISNPAAHVVCGISGWLSQKDDVQKHWRDLETAWPDSDCCALRWEAQAQLDLGIALTSFGGSAGAGGLLRQAARRATRAAPAAAALPLLAVQAVSLLGNPWSVAQLRAIASGQILADCLRTRIWGPRPVTLVGFSLGTRVILEALAVLGADQAQGLVHDVVLLGGATPIDHPGLDAAGRVAAGAVINGYATNDLVLRALFQGMEWKTPIGIERVERSRIRNVDLTDLVSGHVNYRERLRPIVARVREVASERQAAGTA